MSQCKVYLENYTGTYYAGSEIRGRLECYFDDETSVRGIKIRLKCNEHNEWTDTEEYLDTSDNKHKTRYVNFTGDHEIVRIEQILYGSDSGSRTVPRGRHVYPFEVHLPHNLPSTFNGPYGCISYSIKGIVDRPMRTDYEDKFIFVVKSIIDLNKLSEEYFTEANYSDEKTVCCWCCRGGSVTMDVELPKTAFVPGESVDFKVIISNLSNDSVEGLTIDFKKEVKFKVESPESKTRADSENILTFNEHGVGAHGEHTYDLEMIIPDYVEVPNFALCNLFESNYIMHVTAKMGSCTLDMDIYIYPKMGHIPRGQTGDHVYYPDSGQYGASNGTYPPPIEGAYPPPPGVSYPPALHPGGVPDLGPPSYPAGPGVSPYPPPPGVTPYPPAPGASPYPPIAGSPYPPGPPPPGGYPPSYAAASPGYPPGPSYSDKPVYPGGVPTAPSAFGGSAPPPPGGYSKDGESSSVPSAPAQTPTELPPPSYNEIQKTNPPYPPQ